MCAMILSENRILAMHDERSPYFYLPGGRVKMGETADQAVVREIREAPGEPLSGLVQSTGAAPSDASS